MKREMVCLAKKGLILGVICLMLAITALAGCSGNKEGKGGNDSNNSASVNPSNAPDATPAPPVTIVMERPLYNNSNPDTPANVRIRGKIKEAINVDVQVVGQQNPTNMDEKPNLMIAAGEDLDIFQMQAGGPNDWRHQKANGTILPLNDLIDQYGQDIIGKVNPIALQACTDDEGTIWCLPDESNATTTAMVVRKDWLTKAGLDTPVTIEDFENMMQVFKDKFHDVGFLPLYGPRSLETLFSGSFTPVGPQKWLDTDGKIKQYFLHPQYKDFLAKMIEWYNKGYIHKEFFTLPYQQASDLGMVQGKSGVMVNWINGPYLDGYVKPLRDADPDADLTIVAPPKGPAGHFVDQAKPISAEVMISAKSKNPEAAMKFINWSMGTDEGALMTKFGVKDYDWEWVDESNNILKATDKEVDVDRYGYAIFASTRLNYYTNKYITGDIEHFGPAFLNDPDKYPSKPSVDILINYDTSTMKSQDYSTTLDTLFDEAQAKIITGQWELSEWDKFIEKWHKNGGDQWIEDFTKQFNEQTKK